MLGPFIVWVLVLLQYGLLAWAFPHSVVSTTSVPPTATTSERRLDHPKPRPSPTPWQNQLPISVPGIQNRDTANTTTASPTPTATGVNFGQLVIASTKQSTLPPAVCAFGPYSSGNTSALEIWACSYGYLIGTTSHTFNSLDRCSSDSGRYFCVYTYSDPYYTQTIYTGAVELAQGILISRSTTSTYVYTTLHTTETVLYTASANTYTGGSYSYSYSFSTSTQTRGFSVVLVTYTYNEYTYITQTTTYSASTYARTYTENPASYYYITSSKAYTQCGNPPLYSFAPWSNACWSSYDDLCQKACPTAVNGYSIQAFNLKQLQATVTSMTMSLSMSMSSTDTHFYFVDMYTSQTLTPTGTASTVDSSPSGYLSFIRSKPPSCVNALNSTCTSLYIAAKRCWSEAFPPGPQTCLCSNLVLTDCLDVCQSTPDDRISYYNWAMNLCKGYTSPLNSTDNSTFGATWAEVQNRSSSILSDLYPFPWTLSPTSENKNGTECPSKSLKLTSFAINNVLVGIAIPILGKRTFIKWLAQGMRWFTKGSYGIAGSKSWPAISVLVVGVNVFANFINAVLVKRTSGFSTPAIGSMLLLWAARPRLVFFATMLAPAKKEDSMYISLGISTLLSEFMVQTIGGVVLVQTINFFTKRGYFQVNALQYVHGSWSALLMYSGAVIWVISIAFFYIYVIWKYLYGAGVFALFFPAIWNTLKSTGKAIWHGLAFILSASLALVRRCFQYRRAGQRSEEDGYDMGEVVARPYVTKGWKGWLEQMGLGGDVLKTVSQVHIFFWLPYVAQWLFWVGLVEAYGDRYCVPVLWQMTVVWTIFDLICIILSASH